MPMMKRAWDEQRDHPFTCSGSLPFIFPSYCHPIEWRQQPAFFLLLLISQSNLSAGIST